MTKEIWLSILVVIGVSLLAGCKAEKPREKALTPVSVAAVETFAGGGGARYSGNVEPASRVDLAFRVGGYVEEIHMVQGPDGRMRKVQEGDLVTAGTVLARVRESDYRAKIDQAKSQLAQATLGVNQAKSQVQEAEAAGEQATLAFNRAKNLFESQSLTKADLDNAKGQYEMVQARLAAARELPAQAQARIDGARAMVQEGELALADCALKAPLDAMLLKRMVEVGSLVGPGAPGFVLADTTLVKVVFGAPDSLLPLLSLGTPMTVRTEAVAGDFGGRITRISPAADPRSRVFDVEISVPNSRGRLKVGMIVALQAPGARAVREPVPVVPLTAVVRSASKPDGYAVFVAEERDGQATSRARDVTLGETFGNRIAVTQGLKPGERVIVSGATLVKNGESVQILP